VSGQLINQYIDTRLFNTGQIISGLGAELKEVAGERPLLIRLLSGRPGPEGWVDHLKAFVKPNLLIKMNGIFFGKRQQKVNFDKKKPELKETVLALDLLHFH